MKHQIYILLIELAFVLGVACGSYYSTIKVNQVAPEEIEYAYETIEMGIYSHQFNIDHPELQTDRTGDTEFNREWVGRYLNLEKLLENAYGQR